MADAPVIVWTDAHLSPRIAAWLRETYNITAAPVSELGLTSAEDSEVLPGFSGIRVTASRRRRML